VLNRAGVPADRMSIAGYGDQQPVVQNGPRGAEANRRVEIYLVPMPQGRSVPAPAAAPAPEAGPVVPMDQPAPAEGPEMFK
jgi:chemotaxis protein MotB